MSVARTAHTVGTVLGAVVTVARARARAWAWAWAHVAFPLVYLAPAAASPALGVAA
ncbi:hypothetical protein [Kitasatospora sp. NPDC086791]|uniref:hypothetical protein n=1 Tax=Kitasatospora sp. NPDC086791 TaxID=3155178 RepID=UPI00343F80E5